MSQTATLPLFPDLPAFGRPDPAAGALRRRAGVEYLDLATRDVLNRVSSQRLPFQWTINPYRGCEFGCAYCYARDTHGFFALEDPLDFETRVFVKRRAAEALRRRLRKVDLRGQTIALGTATDPYQPAERHFEVTRSLLETLAETGGLSLALTTKSPLVLRDLDLWTELDRRHAVEIHVTVTTLDPRLARRLEGHAPDPAARLRTVERLAEAGLATQVNCMPVMPGINDDEETLAPLFAAARAAGARQVTGQALFLKPMARRHFFDWLAREFPELASLYRKLYARSDYLDEAAQDRLLATFRRLKLESGFPRSVPGRA
jgi:DNA repair photolyase